MTDHLPARYRPYNPYVTPGEKGYEPRFKAKHGARRPVRGGRWFVRKLEASKTGKHWRAWTHGQAQQMNRTFRTQQEAINWAQKVAYAYNIPMGYARDQALIEIYCERFPNRAKASR